jgi:NitT/TauT family transport system permease protein
MSRRLNIRGALIGLLMFFAIWQVLAWIIHRPIMPSPVQVLPIFGVSLFGNLGIHFLASTARVLVFLPVIYVLMGIIDISKIFLIAIIIFFQILVVVRDEAANLHPELILSVRSLGAGRRALFRYVYFPASLPAMLTALRVSVGTAIAVLFIAEQSLTTYGLGYYIVVETYQVLRYPEMYAGILAMSLLGLALYFVIYNLELSVNRYKAGEEN